jgi:predicted HAD superfamily Cof-like phosphohydrolase
MKESNALNDVAQFHRTFNHPILDKPQMPSKERAALRVSLLQEELNELKEAIANNDLVEVADALCDLQYVLAGAVLEFGLGEAFADLFAEVQRSNMSKVCHTEEEAQATVAHFDAKGQEAYYEAKDDFFLVFRKSDNKTLKSINYSEADLKAILQRFGAK